MTEDDRKRLLTALDDLGGKSGNQALREALGWDERKYKAVKDDLISQGGVVSGRGRGGSVALKGCI